MKKVLILSYYFPPCNLTAAQRIGSWEKYLPEFGFYPIVVTRNWTGKELLEEQRLMDSGDMQRVVKNENSEIHFLPYKSTIRDFFFINKSKFPLFRYVSKFFTLMQTLLNFFFIRTYRFKNLYYYADQLLSADKSITLLMTSVDPFEQFFMAYLLKKRHPNVKWIADYRDDWTTSEIDRFPFRKFQAYLEKKWVGTSSAILSISPYYTQKISALVGVKGFTVLNGFDNINSLSSTNTDPNNFILTYNGTLYASQPIEIFLEGFKLFVSKNPNINVHLYFPGLLFNKIQANRVINALHGFELNYTVTERVSRQEVLSLQERSDLLVMVAHKNIKGIPSSKIFEYIGLRKHFIVCPGDGDILDEIAYSCKLGNVLETKENVSLFLQEKLQEKTEGGKAKVLNEDSVIQFSAKKQVAFLSNILNQIMNE
jgi:glycosyltransferase involved in cell wall biosynthesis